MSKQRQVSSTAYPILFLMVDSGDHVTGKTGLTPTVTISKNGGAFASPSGAVTELAHGWYALAGNATDRATLGELLIHATASGADPTDDKYEIVTGDPFNALIADVTKISGDSTAADALETMLDGTGGSILSLGALAIHRTSGVAVDIQSDNDVAVNISGNQAMQMWGTTGGITVQSGYGNPLKLETVGDGYAEALTLITNGPTAFSIVDEVTVIDVEDTLRNMYARVNALSAGAVTVVSPIAVPSQAITLYQGDSYYGNKTQVLSWNIPLNIADLTGATAIFKLKHASLFTKSMTVSNAGTDGSQTLTVALTAAETAAMTAGSNYKYEVEVSWTSPTEVRTVVVGSATITEQLS